MKRRLLAGLAFIVLLFTVNSCTTYDDYLSEYEVRKLIEQAIRDYDKEIDLDFTKWKIVNIEVKEGDWKWNDKAEQWQVFSDLPELTEFVYEEGAALGYVFLGEQGKDEVQIPLPYVNTYYDGQDNNGNDIIFTETISCDFQLGNPSTVGFYIKESDLAKDNYAPNNYNFRVVLIW
ncbi:MAG: hypothetical protein GXZ03_05785 [Proteiniphilum sp.]|nr:hypothetical protein [Proteiniphilum sp.]